MDGKAKSCFKDLSHTYWINMSEIGASRFQTVPQSGHLSVPNSDIRLCDLCSKLGQPNCLKSGQTKLGRLGNLGS